MSQKSETRAVEARALWNSCGGWFRDLFSLCTLQSQILTAAHQAHPEMASMASPLAFGGGGHG